MGRVQPTTANENGGKVLEGETTATLLRGRRVVFVLNPVAGGARAGSGLEHALTSVCAEAGLNAVIQPTLALGHATAVAVEAEAAAEAQAAGPAALFVCGGDGSLNEVLNGVRRPETIVGQIPSGTANVWAKEAGIPNRAEAALRAQLSAPLVSIDLGRVTWPEGSGGRRFLLMASFGLDAVAVHAVNLRLKRRLGPLAYVLAGVRVGLRDRGFQAALRFDGASEESVSRGHAGLRQYAALRRSGSHCAGGVGGGWTAGLRGISRPWPDPDRRDRPPGAAGTPSALSTGAPSPVGNAGDPRP